MILKELNFLISEKKIAKRDANMKSRYEELDSLRGIAALVVMFSHLVTVFPNLGKKIMYSDYSNLFSFIWAGHSAVVLFFILSGFVLTISLSSKKVSYIKYVTKRFIRIYLPYLIVLLMSLVVIIAVSDKIGTVSGLINWADWSNALSYEVILSHLLFLGEYNSDVILCIIWSLVHELRISLIFPFILVIISKISWKKGCIIAISFSALGYLLQTIIPTKYGNLISTNYFITFHYLAMFIIGIILAINSNKLKFSFSKKWINILFLTIGGFLFFYPKTAFLIQSKLMGEIPFNLYQILVDWYIALGAGLIIISSLNSNSFSKFLKFKPVIYLGKISYSVYLIHVLVLLTVVYLLNGIFPAYLLLIISLTITFPISAVFYKFIEAPSILFANRLLLNTIKFHQLVKRNRAL